MPVTVTSSEQEKKSGLCEICRFARGLCGHYVKVEQYEVSTPNGKFVSHGARRYCEKYEHKPTTVAP